MDDAAERVGDVHLPVGADGDAVRLVHVGGSAGRRWIRQNRFISDGGPFTASGLIDRTNRMRASAGGAGHETTRLSCGFHRQATRPD